MNINEQIEKEMEKFYNSVYSKGVKGLNLIPLFKKCVMNLSPQQYLISVQGLKQIVNTPEDKLTVIMIEKICKVIMNVPFKLLYKNFDEAIGDQLKIEKFVIEYTNYVDSFQKDMQVKRATLQSLSPNGLRIISKA